MSKVHLDKDDAAGRPGSLSGGSNTTAAMTATASSASSTTEEDWHSTPATPDTATAQRSPAMKAAATEAEVRTKAAAGAGAEDSGVDDEDQAPGGAASAPASTDDVFSDIALDDRASVHAAEAAQAAQFFATPPPLPARPPTVLTGPSSFVDDDDTVEAGPSSLPQPPPLPPRRQPQPPPTQASSSFQLPSPPPFPPPNKRRATRPARPSSLASVIGSGAGGGGTSSPSSSTASPRSSSFFSHNYLNRPLPQTPTSRPSSFLFFSSPTAAPQLHPQFQSVPRPLRLRPSPKIRSGGGGSGGGSDDGSYHPEGEYDMAWLRAHQSAARMARRRQWKERMSPEQYERHQRQLESQEGTFEVLESFLARLARAENETLEPDKFPRSRAEQDRQREDMATMRQETVEALQPLLAYGPSDPAAAVVAPKTTTALPASSASSVSASVAPPPKAAAPATAAARHAVGLPPTPPQSPRRGDPRRESGMSIASQSLGGYDDHGSTSSGRASTDTWRQSMQRASALFSWGGTSSPAGSTRFSGD